MPEYAVDGANDHVLHFVEGYRILLTIQGGRPQEDENSFDTCCCGVLDVNDIIEINIDSIINIDGMGGWD